jgi:hypothetical protein
MFSKSILTFHKSKASARANFSLKEIFFTEKTSETWRATIMGRRKTIEKTAVVDFPGREHETVPGFFQLQPENHHQFV